MNILITGGTGFIGSNLIEKLKNRGHRIVCVSKDILYRSYLESMQVEVIIGDLNDGISWKNILPGIDYIYHLAGITRTRKSKEYYEGNFYATRSFLRDIQPYCDNVKRFLYVSSLAAAGPACNGKRITEDCLCHPVSHYGKSKLMAEDEVRKYADRLPVTIVRPSAVYGPRERDMFEYFKLILKNIQPLIGLRRKLLNLIHVYDLVDGIIKAAEHPRSVGQVYFLGSKRAYYVEEIGNAISQAVGKHPVKIRIPHVFVYAFAAVSEMGGRVSGRQVFFNLQKVRESIQGAWDCSIRKASEELGFYPVLSLENGMMQTYQWYKNQKWL